MHVVRAFSSVHAGSASLCGALLLVSIACGASPTSPSDSPGSPGTGGAPSTGVQLADDFGGRRLFPDDNWWNQEISSAPHNDAEPAWTDEKARTTCMGRRLVRKSQTTGDYSNSPRGCTI